MSSKHHSRHAGEQTEHEKAQADQKEAEGAGGLDLPAAKDDNRTPGPFDAGMQTPGPTVDKSVSGSVRAETGPKPTIGRTVHYRLERNGALRPAVVVVVHSDTCVALQVFQGPTDHSDGVTFSPGGLHCVSNAEQGTEHGMWSWPERV